jgi:hypothetical protein
MNVIRSVAFCALTLVPLATFAKAVDMSAAPLDEYFGTQKMSALGIRMRIDDLGRRYHAHLLGDADTLHDALIAENSYHAWQSRYPRDRWLAPTAFHLEQLYAELQLPQARNHATSMLHFIDGSFGATKYGHLSRLRLAQGFPPLGPPIEVSASPAAMASTVPDAVASGTPASGSAPSVSPPAAPPAAPAVVPSAVASKMP